MGESGKSGAEYQGTEKARPNSIAIDGHRIRALLVDLDGVVTKTAAVHAAAWKRLLDEYLKERSDRECKPFEAFDIQSDYRKFVDGKPRYDGVRSFLQSRGIALPEGEPDDAPECETIFGLGNRKNHYFRIELEKMGVDVYASSVDLIRSARRAGLKTAVVSSSRNCQAVLSTAALADLFDARVDGTDMARLGLLGKPEPEMFIEAANRLDVTPEETAVIEDAISGVQAGTKGGFGLVVGVDREGAAEELRRHGADIVVSDLAQLHVEQGVVKPPRLPPSALEHMSDIELRMAGKTLVAFLDYDGTLTPIVEDYTKAPLSDEMRAVLADLSSHCTVAIVSGRDVEVVRQFVKLDSVYYAGSHGFEIVGPEGWSERLERGVEFLTEIDQAERQLRNRLSKFAGHAVERKRFSIAVHYRRAPEADLSGIEAVVDEVIAGHPMLRKGHGKKVFRIQPDIDWDKGHAVLWLLERLDLDNPDILPVYLGDDVTDEDAFRALAGRGLAVIVRDHDTRPTAADYTLADTEEVRRFLEILKAIASESNRAS